MILLHKHILTVFGYHPDDKNQVTLLFITPTGKSQMNKPLYGPDSQLEKNTSFKLCLWHFSLCHWECVCLELTWPNWWSMEMSLKKKMFLEVFQKLLRFFFFFFESLKTFYLLCEILWLNIGLQFKKKRDNFPSFPELGSLPDPVACCLVLSLTVCRGWVFVFGQKNRNFWKREITCTAWRCVAFSLSRHS